MSNALETIRSERLELRRLTEDDVGLSLALWNDPEFIQFVGDRGIRTLEEASKAMQEGPLKIWRDHGYGPYVISLANDTEPMGICGLFKRENLQHPDIGYALFPRFMGKGFAYEAAEAVRNHARDTLGLDRITAIVSPDNPRSIRLLEKLGMTVEGPVRMPDEDEDLLLYGMPL
jgi:ribosomal-protein-alanine N-acetyltransferase